MQLARRFEAAHVGSRRRDSHGGEFGHEREHERGARDDGHRPDDERAGDDAVRSEKLQSGREARGREARDEHVHHADGALEEHQVVHRRAA
eukprot:7376492-Prymnesium_polylepis.1